MENVCLNLNNEEQKVLGMIMHEIYSSINSITKTLYNASKKDLSKYDDQLSVKEDILMVSESADTLRMYLDFWQLSNSSDYFKKNPTTRINIWNAFNRPNEYFKSRMKSKKLSYNVIKEVDVIPYVEGWPILHAISNIMFDNAIKYSPEYADIECAFDVDDDELIISMENTGPYLREEERKSVFLCGGRGEYAIETKTRGQGYGMNFLKLIIDGHNGDVCIDSTQECIVNGIPYGKFICKVIIPLEQYFEDENEELFDED